MCDMGVSVVIKDMHDVVDSCGDKWDGDGWGSELDGSVCGS